MIFLLPSFDERESRRCGGALLLVLPRSVTTVLPRVRAVTESNAASIQCSVWTAPAAAAARPVVSPDAPEVEAEFRERAYSVRIG